MPFRPDPDEDPSEEDQARFGEDRVSTGYCPDCGAQVFDDADVCPRCFAFIAGEIRAKPKGGGFFREQWKVLLVLALIFGMVGSLLIYFLARYGRG